MGALIHRIRIKLLSLKRSSISQPKQYDIETEWQPLVFPSFSEPEISIIIPIYNKPNYTFSCLKSILENTKGASYEVIIVDDGSGNDTHDMLSLIKNINILRNECNMGVVKSYNRGAENANGRYLVFLNNDTLVIDEWLLRLENTFDQWPDTGLVGAKLIYPDGRLQEAGGIVWRDGSSWNYGHLDDPNRPEYNYVREVDYCTGACLMIERELFINLDGFDKLYSPAYYEDVDLAFKVRACGKKVIYQPGATVIHFEGITSGKDLSRGVKRYQVINQDKFKDKWQKKLVGHRNSGIMADLEKDRYTKQRVLVLDARMVMPDRDSGSVRMYNILKIMVELGCKVTFSSASLVFQEPYLYGLQQIGVEVLYAPFIKSIDDYLKKWGGLFDVVILSRADLADKYMDSVKQYCKNACTIFDTVDVHFIREQRMAAIKHSSAIAWIAKKRKKQELSLVQKADVTLVVSPIEKKIIHQELPDENIEILSNIHEVHGSSVGFKNRKGILFIGGFEHPPNIDAVCYYIETILPMLRKKLNGVKSYIIGSNPPKKISDYASDDLIITGHVKDIEPYLYNCRVSIAPLKYGAGVKGKINLSMSYGLPVVATGLAVEGMNLSHGNDVLIADNPQYFADELAAIYENVNLWRKLSENGKANIRAHFSFEAAGKTLKNILKL
jgi:GT2 family glycosyltransferase/glycosyltransferase involved in cell wall biosynthesis